MSHKVFGRLPTGKRLQRIKETANYKGGSFQNESVTPIMAEDASFWKTAKDFFSRSKNTDPSTPLPSVITDLKALSLANAVIWFGHSSYLVHLDGKTILVDPVFSRNASPVSLFAKAYKGTTVYSADDFPTLDAILLTHDHYDHLDYPTILKLKSKTKNFFTSLGVGAHLQFWGVKPELIHEFAWWESKEIFPGMTLTAAPARHFSGRGIRRGKTLWSSFILTTKNHNLYLGGDSGYDTHFKRIGEKHGPFDLAILESGQYNVNWPHIHMMPEETVQAGVDLRSKYILPVHWGKFTLALHPWNEPVKRVVATATKMGIPVTTPMIGEPIVLDVSYPVKEWWL